MFLLFNSTFQSIRLFFTKLNDPYRQSSRTFRKKKATMVMFGQKLYVLFILAVICSGMTDAASMEEKYTITNPSIDFNGPTLMLNFTVSDFINNDMIEYSLWNTDCKQGNVNASNFFDATSAELPADQLDGSGKRETSLMLDMKFPEMSGSSIAMEYYIDGEAKATIAFCVRFGVYSSPNLEDVHEINFEEVVLTLYVDLSDKGFVLIEDHDLIGKDQFDEEQDQSYGSEGFLCDYDGSEIPPNMADPLEPGSNFQLCVAPNEQAQIDGITMNLVESMEYVRTDDNTGNQVTQPAVVNGNTANNGLSTLECDSSGCQMQTILQLAMFEKKICDGPGVSTATDLEGNSIEPNLDADPELLCPGQVPSGRRRGLVVENSQEIIKKWVQESRMLQQDMKIDATGIATLKFGFSRRHLSKRRILQEGGITASKFNIQLTALTFDELEEEHGSNGNNKMQGAEENSSSLIWYISFSVAVCCMILLTYSSTRDKSESTVLLEGGADLVSGDDNKAPSSSVSVATTMDDVSARSSSIRSTTPSNGTKLFDVSARVSSIRCPPPINEDGVHSPVILQQQEAQNPGMVQARPDEFQQKPCSLV